MNLFGYIYKKSLLVRYDKDPAVPYYSVNDFKDLKEERFEFINSKGTSIKYFYYYYDEYDKEKIVLFLHGMGPGHTAYMREMNEIAKGGFKVLTLDYTGCGESGGETMYSLNAPTRDVNELLKYLDIKEEIVVAGHSLGSYTGLNILNINPNIKKSVFISPFLSGELICLSLLKSRYIANRIGSYEKTLEPDYCNIDNIKFLKETDDRIMFIHSRSDNVVNYEKSTKLVQDMNRDNFSFIIKDNRYHNPNYTDDAVKYLNDTFAEYNKKFKKKNEKNLEARKKFFSNISLERLTDQDIEIFKEVNSFIKK